jgi:shikimate dehydrogenase
MAWPPLTDLVRRARSAGAHAEGGVGMLVAQAAEAFAIWTGLEPPLDVMRAALGHTEPAL